MITKSVADIVAERDVKPALPDSEREFFDNHIKPDGKLFETEGLWDYQREIVECDAERVVIEKAAQMGISTIAVGKMLYHALQGRRFCYYLSTADDVRDFVQHKFNPLVDADETLVKQVTEMQTATQEVRRKRADNLRLMMIGAGMCHFRGMQRMADVKTLALDGYVLDEVAEAARKESIELGAKLIDFLPDRLLASDLKWQWELSQPSLPLMDIDESFSLSDQRFYLHRCPRCGTWRCLEEDFPACVFPSKGRGIVVGCAKCKAHFYWSTKSLFARLRRRVMADHLKREWVARYPEREVRGYHLSQLFGPRTLPASIWLDWKAAEGSLSKTARFYVSVLGLPHAGNRQPLTDKIIEACMGDHREQRRAESTVAGVDMGDEIYAAAGRQEGAKVRIVAFVRCRNEEELIDSLKKLDAAAVSDALPEKRTAKKIAHSLRGGAICYFVQGTGYATGDEMDTDIERKTRTTRTLKVNREEAIDAVVEAVTNGDFIFPQSPEMAEVKRHLKRLVKDPQPQGGMKFRDGVANHYGLALAYLLLAVKYGVELSLTRIDYGDPQSWLVKDAKFKVEHV